MKRRKLKSSVKAILIIIISLVGVTYSTYDIIKWNMNIKENNDIKEEINKDVKINTDSDKNQIDYVVDFESIKSRNTDAVAYLTMNNPNINYIVVKGEDNKFYLDHNFDKKANKSGWIFADYHNKFDGTDKNIVIYGHNMKDGSMFGSLKNVLKKDWYSTADHTITLITETNKYTYEVFSTYQITAEDYYINTIFISEDEFNGFIKKIKSRSIYNYGVEVNKDDSILTLSSCIGNGDKRVVLHAKLV